MSRRSLVSDGGLPLADLLHIDECCDRFEAAWRSGGRPELAAFIDDAAETARPRLFGELLALELEFRKEAGEQPDLADYLARFPDQAGVVGPVFARMVPDLKTLRGPHSQTSDSVAVVPNPASEFGVAVARAELGPDARIALREAGYEILGEVGRGGMGVVYLANKVTLNRRCALKMILAGAHAGAAVAARFRAEAETIAHLRHPDIVQIYNVGEAAGLPYFELEYLPGGSLDKLLDGVPWPATIAAELVEVLARAIAEAHRQGVIHRDLKPANVLLDAENRPKVADFGLAKVLDTDDRMTRTQMVLGTPSYMAPEQAEGHSKRVGPTTDVYALGAILYELLTGRPPFRASTALETLNLVRSAEPVPPSRFQPDLPQAAETICLKCLEKAPARRYATADDLAEDLRRFAAGESILAQSAPQWEQAWRWVRRRPAIAAASCVALAALVLLLSGGLYYNAQLREAVRKARSAERSAFEQRNLALGAFNQLVFDVRERLGDSAATRQARRAILGTAIRGLEEIARGASSATDLSRAVAHLKLGEIYGEVGRAGEALGQFEQARRFAEERIAVAPRDLAAIECLRDAHAGLGELAIANHRSADAKENLRRAVALAERVLRADPVRPGARCAVIVAYMQLGRAHAFNDERASAAAHYTKMHDLAAQWVADDPHNATARDLLSSSYRKLADERKLVHDNKGSRPHYRKAIELSREVVAAEPRNVQFKYHLALAVDDLAGVSANQRRFDEARSLFAEAERICIEQIEADPENIDIQLRLILTQSRFGNLERDTLNFDRAVALYRKALDRLETLGREGRLEDKAYFQDRRRKALRAGIADCAPAPGTLGDLNALRSRPPLEACSLLLMRARAMAVRARPAEASAAIVALCDLRPKTPEELYTQARALSACAGLIDDGFFSPASGPSDPDGLSGRCVERALSALSLALEGGFNDVQAIATEEELAPLRQHPAYKALEARLSASRL